METLAKRLAYARGLRGLKQMALSEMSGVAQSDISKIERGESKTTTTVVALAHALQVRAEWLGLGEGEIELGSQAAPSPFRTPVSLERALARLGEALASATPEAARKAAPLLQALITNPEQAGQLAPMIVSVLEKPGRADQTAILSA